MTLVPDTNRFEEQRVSRSALLETRNSPLDLPCWVFEELPELMHRHYRPENVEVISVEPFFSMIARQLGQPLVICGGSDVVQALLGVPCRLHSGIEPEVNLLISRAKLDSGDEISYRQVPGPFEIPAYGTRDRCTIPSVVVNGEGLINCETYTANLRYLDLGHSTYLERGHLGCYNIMVPLKGALMVVSPAAEDLGAAKVYFRTHREHAAFRGKILEMPSQVCAAEFLEDLRIYSESFTLGVENEPWPVRRSAVLGNRSSSDRDREYVAEQAAYTVHYFAIALCRGWGSGWRPTAEALQFCRDLTKHVNQEFPKRRAVYEGIVDRALEFPAERALWPEVRNLLFEPASV